MNRKYRIWVYLFCIHFFIFLSLTAFTQCPANIGFESGNFDNWVCNTGSISGANGSISLNASGPVYGIHTLLKNTSPQGMDPYGSFPINCPNGSGYSIKLGHDLPKRKAQRVSYTFTIPADQNNYSIIYNYAVVFQDPNHADWEQPKFSANVFDVTNNNYIGCSSFSYTASSSLPGFKLSGIKDSVFYKTWTPVTIKLSGYAGRTIRLEFTTNDCTKGGHFGYAYVDVNENCSSPISGNTYCANDTTQTLTAPFGFSGYKWFNGSFSKIIGTDITLHLAPVPLPGTVFAVEVTPFPDQGCIDTVYTTVVYSGEAIDLKVPSTTIIACISNPVDLTSSLISAGSSTGLSFSYFTDPQQLKYVPTPKLITKSGVYYVKATNKVGCTAVKPVTVSVLNYPVFMVVPISVSRPSSADLSTAIADNTPGLSFSYWQDSLATIPLAHPTAIDKSGIYYIKGTNAGGCSVIHAVKVLINEAFITPPNAFSPNGDGVHDEWEIPLLTLYPECTVEIYNRLGQLLFRSLGYNKPWDGKYNGIHQPVGTYYYVIKRRSDLPVIGGSVSIIK